MKRTQLFWIFLVMSLAAASGLHAGVSESLANESRMGIQRGVSYLLEQQAGDGSWSAEPAITALVMKALHRSGTRQERDEIDEAIEDGREFILRHVRPNGAFSGVYQPNLNYTTALCLEALALLDRPEDREVVRNARSFLLALQLREDHPEHPTEPDNEFYGGIGYGSGGPEVPDLSNTQFALEALHATEHLDRDDGEEKAARAAWERAVLYLRSVQRIPDDADSGWTPDTEEDPDYDGGFVYRPDQCRVRGKLTHEFDGEPISYGATTAGGLKSLLHAGVEKYDYRVQAAMEWLGQNYTLEENPGIGAEAYYYYLWTFSKAMQAYGDETLRTADGERYWRRDLLRWLLSLQKAQGHWINEKSGRYMESIPELTTAYAMLAMQAALNEKTKG